MFNIFKNKRKKAQFQSPPTKQNTILNSQMQSQKSSNNNNIGMGYVSSMMTDIPITEKRKAKLQTIFPDGELRDN